MKIVAAMIAAATADFALDQIGLLAVENVGNLVCTAGFVLGEHVRVVVFSNPKRDRGSEDVDFSAFLFPRLRFGL